MEGYNELMVTGDLPLTENLLGAVHGDWTVTRSSS